MMNRHQSKQNLEKLVTYFSNNIYQLKSPAFNETQARQQLIDPFFEAFGWDVHNRLMKPLYLQEVVPEGRVKTNIGKEVRDQQALFPSKDTLGSAYKEYASILDYIAEDEYKSSAKEAIKKPDYRFRIGGQTKFFVEAKKPFVDLSKSQEAIFQVKRYGFSGRVPVSILTDFEEFRVFDCTHKPEFEKPKRGIIKDFDLDYRQYLDEFDKLFDTFSRDAVQAGSLDTLSRKLFQKRTGDFALDKTFLEDLSQWREELARDIAKHPKNRRQLNDYTLNESVQRILDRLVFFRVCEDREIEVEHTLLAILRMWKERTNTPLYSLLNDLFKQRRSLYNGLLFAEHECEQLEVGNDVLIKILQNLNYPFSPYHFNEIGVEILGSIYEKFLGKTIHLTAKTTRIEEKPEVRKAGGVYYTPQYIVNYIVDNTLGKLLYEEPNVIAIPIEDREKQSDSSSTNEIATVVPQAELPRNDRTEKKLKLSPKQVSKLKIIDIACGSGSFLLGAFQKLINYHIEWYTAHPEDIKRVNNVSDVYKDTHGNYHLSPRKKRDILVNNIYGVDIDRQAVEVTQMSLYLKVLEGENAETLNPQMTLALKEVYLPSLVENIKCGNSLIGTDFLAQGELFDEATRRKVNPLDWQREFTDIMASGGFDVVIGNPPYGAEFNSNQKNYLLKKYPHQEYQLDSYLVFVERATILLKLNGCLGYIIPNPWLTNILQKKLRRFIFNETKVLEIVHFNFPVFRRVTVDTEILLVQKANPVGWKTKTKIVDDLESLNNESKIKLIIHNQDEWRSSGGNTVNIFLEEKDKSIINKIVTKTSELQMNFDINVGIKPYQVGKGTPTQTKEVVINRIYDSKSKKDRKYRQYLRGSDINRYLIAPLKKQYIKYGPWLAEPRPAANFDAEEKIFMRQTGDSLIAALDMNKFICLNNMHVLVPHKNEINTKYFLGLINSTLINWYYQCINPEQGEALAEVKKTNVAHLPIRTIDFNNPAEKKMHNALVSLVENMLELNKQLQKVNFDSEKEPIERQIAATDNKIDQLVYRLYNITEEERKLIENLEK
jgi:type I restriction-modification system DNA methylase subunit